MQRIMACKLLLVLRVGGSFLISLERDFPMCFGGGGGGDGGAAEARQAEAARQARITSGRRTIDRTFDGGYWGVNPATAFDPSGTYYTDFGDVWTPAALQYGPDRSPRNEGDPWEKGDLLNPVDRQAQDLIASGKLFTAKEQRPGFDDNYYSGIKKAYTDFYLPQVDEQYDQAKRKLTYKFANTGNLDSSAGANNIANLFRDYNRERASIADRALGAEKDLRSNVEQNRSELISQLQATADPEAAATSSTARAKALATPAPFSPLGDLFKVYTGSLALADQAKEFGGRGSGFKLPDLSSSQKIIW
ncbi:MAG: hypothetical protein ACYC1T_02745 [Sulfuricaulis sp.]